MGQYRCTVLQYRFTILCRNSLDLIQGEWPNSPRVVQTFIKHTRDSQPGGRPQQMLFLFQFAVNSVPLSCDTIGWNKFSRYLYFFMAVQLYLYFKLFLFQFAVNSVPLSCNTIGWNKFSKKKKIPPHHRFTMVGRDSNKVSNTI